MNGESRVVGKGIQLPSSILGSGPISALAPMQDVTNLPFMTVIGKYGSPDYFFTEYLRVHETSRIEPGIIDSVEKNTTGRPVFVQLIGENVPHMVRIVKELLKLPDLAGIDLNMGCPAPKVYKKNVGGGLLRDLAKVDELLGALRENIPGLFTVKMRVGFDDISSFDDFLALIEKHKIDLLSVHGRTVKELYRGEVRYEQIKTAVESVSCPVLANGNIDSVDKAVEVLKFTGAHGVMIGRSCIRNPWIFHQIRDFLTTGTYYKPTLADVYAYIQDLKTATQSEDNRQQYHISYLKKYLNFIGQGVDPAGEFLKAMRRVQSYDEFEALCQRMLLDNGRNKELFADKPYPGLIARPNCEDECSSSA